MFKLEMVNNSTNINKAKKITSRLKSLNMKRAQYMTLKILDLNRHKKEPTLDNWISNGNTDTNKQLKICTDSRPLTFLPKNDISL